MAHKFRCVRDGLIQVVKILGEHVAFFGDDSGDLFCEFVLEHTGKACLVLSGLDDLLSDLFWGHDLLFVLVTYFSPSADRERSVQQSILQLSAESLRPRILCEQ